jgi:hypothetical protein
VSTEHDADTGIGGRASQAAQILDFARELLVAAVIYERERGGSWEEIGRYLYASPERAEADHGPAVDRWHAGFDEPYRDDASGRKRVPNLPPAAYDPKWHGSVLDSWAKRHLTLVNDPRPVTGSLRLATQIEDDLP